MSHSVDRKVKTAQRNIRTFLGLLILINLIGFIVFAFLQSHHESEFKQFQAEIQNKSALYKTVNDQLGFGKMIHSFKNLVIRGERDYRTQSYTQAVQDNIDRILEAIRQYRRQFAPLSEAEQAGLNGVEQVVRNYQSMLPLVNSLREQGLSVSEIDARVVVDDRPAMNGMEAWRAYLTAHSEKRIEALNKRSQSTLLMYLAVVMLISVIWVLVAFEVFVLRALVRPIINLNRRIERFAKGDQEELERDIPVEGAAELQRLATSVKEAFAIKRASRKQLASLVESRTQELTQTKNRLKRQTRLLETLWKAGNLFMVHRNLPQVAGYLLEQVLDLTQSQYGFIGEVLKDEDGNPYLKIHKMSDLSWNAETRKLYQESMSKGFEFRDMDTLFGHAIVTQKVVISNDLSSDPRAGGLPEGHPPLDSFLGVPFFYGSELVGLYGLANRPQGYDESLVEYLEPFTQNYGNLIFVRRMLAEQEQVLEELEKERNAAESANLAKSEFLASMSHELRTPLNSVIGFTQLLHLDDSLNSEQKESLEEIERAGKHLLDLIEDVLDLSKVESGHIDLSIGPVEAKRLIQESVSLVQTAAAQRQLEIQVEVDSNMSVRADGVRLKQVLTNLLTNAVKYNVERGRIRIEGAKHGSGEVTIRVCDTGIGIQESKRDQLFQPFNRLGLEGGAVEGTGVGLAIVKTLVELMGGTIGYTPNLPQGSCFTVTLEAQSLPPDEVCKVDSGQPMSNQGGEGDSR